jgi:glycosyltransferase involved in cell wall biosynthesis
MKILIVYPNFWIYGGGERVIVRLANYLTDHYHQVTILSQMMCDAVRKDIKDARLIFAKNLPEMAQWIKKIHADFDVINYHNDPVQLLSFGVRTPGVWMCNEPPQVWLETGKLDERQKDIVRKFIKRVVVADEFNQKRFEDLYGADSTIIPYGIDYEFLQKGDGEKFRRKYEIDERDFVITQIGFIHPLKNQMQTIKTFKEVKDQLGQAKLILAGYDKLPYTKEVKDFMFKNNLQADVIFTGVIPYEEIRDLHQATNVFFAPIKSQGGWLSIFDSLACGNHTIVSEEATCASILKENKLGDVGNYEKNILRCQEVGPQMQHYMDWVKENLSWDKFSEQMLKVFKEVAK